MRAATHGSYLSTVLKNIELHETIQVRSEADQVEGSRYQASILIEGSEAYFM